MKKSFLSAAVLGFMVLSLAGPAGAAWHLACDPYPAEVGVDKAIVEINGVEQPQSTPTPRGADLLLMRLPDDMTWATYTFRAKVGNQYGWSAYSAPFVHAYGVPGAPGIRVVQGP